MWNLRNALVSVSLIAVMVIAFGLAAFQASVRPDAGESHPDQSFVPSYPGLLGMADERYPDRSFVTPAASYRDLQGECADVPLRESAGCHRAVAAPPPPYRSADDECFDVPLRELAGCQEASQTDAP